MRLTNLTKNEGQKSTGTNHVCTGVGVAGWVWRLMLKADSIKIGKYNILRAGYRMHRVVLGSLDDYGGWCSAQIPPKLATTTF